MAERSPGSTSPEVSTPFVKRLQLEPVSLSRHEAWFKLGDVFVVLKFDKNSTVRITLFRSGKVVGGPYVVSQPIDCTKMQIPVENRVDACEPISKIINNYPQLIEQYELEEKAKAVEILEGRAVPSLPREWEVLVYSLTKMLLSSRVIKTFYTYEGTREVVLGVYCYSEGYYRECEEQLKNEITQVVSKSKLLDVRTYPGLVGTVVKNVEMRTLTLYKPTTRCLLFRDKVFCWDLFLQTKDLEKSLLDPNPELIVTHRIPWRINPDRYKTARQGLLKYIPPQTQQDLVELFKGLAPKSFKAFLDWVKYPGEREEDAYPRVVLLLEIIGYTLYPHDYPFHKAILLVGEGSNGKSTYLRLIEKIIGKENVSSINLADLDPRVNRFAAADLFNKLANISSEPVKTKSFDATLFKMLTGEDLVRFERKYRDPFYGYNYAKMIFSANELPSVTEDTYAFWRRWIVIEFPNRFNPDPEFFDRTFTDEEIEGIIICALNAFRLVLERKGFTEQGTKDPREEWLARSNPIYRVIKKMEADGLIEFTRDGYVVKKDLYELYKRYVEVLQEEYEDIMVVEQRDFTKYLTRFFPVRVGDKRIEGKKKHVYLGVRLKNYARARELVGELETLSLDITSYSSTQQLAEETTTQGTVKSQVTTKQKPDGI